MTAVEHDKEPGLPQIIEQEPAVVEAPKPKRVIAVTPEYMNNSSATELNTILGRNHPPTPKTPITSQIAFEGQLPPPVAIGSSNRDRGRFI